MRSPPAPSAALFAGPAPELPASDPGRFAPQNPEHAPEAQGPSRMTLKAEEDAHRPPWQPLPVYGFLPLPPGSGARSHRPTTWASWPLLWPGHFAASGNIVQAL